MNDRVLVQFLSFEILTRLLTINVTRRKLRPMYQWYSSSVASAEAQSRKNWTAWLEGRWEDHVTRACTNCWTPFAVPFQCSCGGTTTVISNHHCCSTTYCVYNSTISFKVKYIKGIWLFVSDSSGPGAWLRRWRCRQLLGSTLWRSPANKWSTLLSYLWAAVSRLWLWWVSPILETLQAKTR